VLLLPTGLPRRISKAFPSFAGTVLVFAGAIMDIARLVLEYIRAILSWPVVLGLLGIYFLKTFHQPVADLLRRFTKAAGYGVSIEAAGPSTQLQEIKETGVPRPVEDQLREYVRENPAEVVREFIRTFNAYWFERSFNLIFGTQILLLEYLLDKGKEGESYVGLEQFHREFLRRGGFQTTQFADYLGFLLYLNFIRYEGDPIQVYITPYGVDFVSYLRAQYAGHYRLKPL
jgi:hypothetical protein